MVWHAWNWIRHCIETECCRSDMFSTLLLLRYLCYDVYFGWFVVFRETWTLAQIAHKNRRAYMYTYPIHIYRLTWMSIANVYHWVGGTAAAFSFVFQSIRIVALLVICMDCVHSIFASLLLAAIACCHLCQNMGAYQGAFGANAFRKFYLLHT